MDQKKLQSGKKFVWMKNWNICSNNRHWDAGNIFADYIFIIS